MTFRLACLLTFAIVTSGCHSATVLRSMRSPFPCAPATLPNETDDIAPSTESTPSIASTEPPPRTPQRTLLPDAQTRAMQILDAQISDEHTAATPLVPPPQPSPEPNVALTPPAPLLATTRDIVPPQNLPQQIIPDSPPETTTRVEIVREEIPREDVQREEVVVVNEEPVREAVPSIAHVSDELLATLAASAWRRAFTPSPSLTQTTNNESAPNVVVDTDARQRQEQWRRLNQLRDGTTVSKSRANYVTASQSPYRWTNDAAEQAVLVAVAGKTDGVSQLFETVAAIPNVPLTAVATSAILATRYGNSSTTPTLRSVASDAALPVSIRCAAVETLAGLGASAESVNVFQTIIAATREQNVAPRDDDAKSRAQFIAGTPPLFVEAVVALAACDRAAAQQPLTDSLTSKSLLVRQEVVAIWRDTPEDAIPNLGTLPPALTAMLQREQDTAILTAIPTILIRWNHPSRFEMIRGLLDHQQAVVRVAAIESLALCNNSDRAAAIEIVKSKQNDSAPRTRACVARTLRGLGVIDTVIAMADDTSSEVRVEVAASLGTAPQTQAVREIVQRYLGDPALAVIVTTLRSIAASWNVHDAGTILIDALVHRSQAVRQVAARELATIWSDFSSVDPVTLTGEQNGQWKTWKQQFEAYCQSLPPEVQSRGATAAIPQTSPDSAVALASAIENLRSDDVLTRRRAAQVVQRESKHVPLTDVARGAIFEVAVRERDLLTTLALLQTMSNHAPEEGVRLAVAILFHPNTEVRRAACGVIGASGTVNEAVLLLDVLDAENSDVVESALAALTQRAEIVRGDVACRNEVMHRVRPLLASRTVTTRIDAAALLYTLGDSEGRETLTRLAHSTDVGTKLAAVRRIADVGTNEFAPLMELMLQENGSIRRIAQSALDKWK
ncbi:MAG: HEAT repeat domain-containing protein [Thermoguttaceae bacterium]